MEVYSVVYKKNVIAFRRYLGFIINFHFIQFTWQYICPAWQLLEADAEPVPVIQEATSALQFSVGQQSVEPELKQAVEQDLVTVEPDNTVLDI